MSSDSQRPLANGHIDPIYQLNVDLQNAKYMGTFHGDDLLADKEKATTGTWTDIKDVLALKNWGSIGAMGSKFLRGDGLDVSILKP